MVDRTDEILQRLLEAMDSRKGTLSEREWAALLQLPAQVVRMESTVASNTKAAEIMAAAGVTGEYIGMTPTKMSSPPREQEIEWWLEKHPEVERWVALDDGLLELDHLKGGGFVRTSYATGLLDEHVEAAIAVLEGENVE